MKTLFILNDPPYATERCYNGLRAAGSLVKREDQEVKIFLMGDAAACAKRGQTVSQGHYNVEVMLGNVTCGRGEVGVCGGCMDARGIADTELAEGTARSTLAVLTDWMIWADKVLVF